MNTQELISYILGGLTVLTALMVVLNRHPVRSVLFLIITFFLISAQYVMMNAQFIAIVNIIVYAGAIMVLFLFVLMLLNLNKDTEPQKSSFVRFAAVISGGILLLVLTAVLKDSMTTTARNVVPGATDIGLVKNLGHLLFTEYVVPFEVSSILFLAAMVGAVLLGKKEINTNQ